MDTSAEGFIQKKVLRFAQDFGIRLRHLLNASSLERSDKR